MKKQLNSNCVKMTKKSLILFLFRMLLHRDNTRKREKKVENSRLLHFLYCIVHQKEASLIFEKRSYLRFHLLRNKQIKERLTRPNCSKQFLTSSKVLGAESPPTKIFLVRVTICKKRSNIKLVKGTFDVCFIKHTFLWQFCQASIQQQITKIEVR